MTHDELKEILRLHEMWLRDEKGGVKANLRDADLSRSNLRESNLIKADLSGVDLCWADLSGADLSRADLRWADLSGADLSGANLRWADLSGADLSGADLREANLRGANLFRVKSLSVVSAGPLGRDNRITYFKYLVDEVNCGCFRGTLDEFAAKVEKTHRDNPVHLAEYRAAIAFFRAMKEMKEGIADAKKAGA